MKEGLLYANAVARSKENGLITDERMNRLFAASDLEEAMRVLAEAGYGGGTMPADPADYEVLLKHEEEALAAFCRSVPDTGLELFFLRQDYHNLKCVLKARYGGVDLGVMVKDGDIPLERLQAAIDGEAELSPEMMGAIEEVKKAMTLSPSPRAIDCTVDRAYAAEVSRRVTKASSLLTEYFKLDADTKNIDVYARTVRIGGSFDFFAQSFSAGGTLSLQWFADRMEQGLDGLSDCPYPRLIQVLKEEGIVAYERARENFALDFMKKERYDMFREAPIAGYYLAKECEIRTVRMALTCIKNGVDKEEMEKRKRECYA